MFPSSLQLSQTNQSALSGDVSSGASSGGPSIEALATAGQTPLDRYMVPFLLAAVVLVAVVALKK